LEGKGDRRAVVLEVEHDTVVLLRVRALEPGSVLLAEAGLGILLEELDAAARVVRQRELLIELDLRAHAVALDDAVDPRPP
jgi:hypothetical protein